MRETFGAIWWRSSTRFNPGHMTARAIETRRKPEADRVTADGENDGHRAACRLSGPRGGNIPRGGDDDDALCYEVGRERRQRLIVPVGPAFLDVDVAAFYETRLFQSLTEGISIETVGVR